MKTLFLAAALCSLAAGPAAALPPPPAPATLDLRDVLPVCEQALVAAIGGHDAGPVLEQAFRALPADQKAAAIGVCQVYALGAVSMLKHMSAAPALPAAGAPGTPI